MKKESDRPRYAVCRLEGWVYLWGVRWPDGFQTQVHGFPSVTDADSWIIREGPRWQEWAPQRVKPDCLRESGQTDTSVGGAEPRDGS